MDGYETCATAEWSEVRAAEAGEGTATSSSRVVHDRCTVNETAQGERRHHDLRTTSSLSPGSAFRTGALTSGLGLTDAMATARCYSTHRHHQIRVFGSRHGSSTLGKSYQRSAISDQSTVVEPQQLHPPTSKGQEWHLHFDHHESAARILRIRREISGRLRPVERDHKQVVNTSASPGVVQISCPFGEPYRILGELKQEKSEAEAVYGADLIEDRAEDGGDAGGLTGPGKASATICCTRTSYVRSPDDGREELAALSHDNNLCLCYVL